MNTHPKRYHVRRLAGCAFSIEEPFAEDAAWEKADCLTDFTFPWTAAPAPRTEFRALWTEARFLFRFDVEDGDVVLDESRDPVQRVLGSDRVELFFARDAALETYFCMEMDPRGEVYDYRASHYRKFSPHWECAGLEIAARLTGEGYRLEGSVPMAFFEEEGLWQGEGRILRAGVYRAEFRHGKRSDVIEDWISWVDPATPTPDFHVVDSFGEFLVAE